MSAPDRIESPANAVLSGQPARVVGFRGTDGGLMQARSVSLDARQPLPGLRVRGARLLRMPRRPDPRGELTFGEVGAHLPFEPRRYFAIYQVPEHEVRGEHAHRELHQFLVCLAGSCSVVMDDGRNRDEVILDSPAIGLHLAPMVWGVQYRYSPDALLLVLASEVYREDDYIRNYDQFLAAVKA